MGVYFTPDQGAKSPNFDAKPSLPGSFEAFSPGIGAVVCEKRQHIMNHPQIHPTFSGKRKMRDAFNCLNAGFILLTLPLYLLALVAALAGVVIGQLAPTWLPAWLQFITTRTFLFVAIGMFVWYLFVITGGSGQRNNTMDFCGIESAFTLFEDGGSGCLLLLGVLVALAAFKVFS